MAEPTKRTPPGWNIAGSARDAYVAGTDPNVVRSGRPSGYLKSNKLRIDGFGTLMQNVAPQRYAGGRIRLSCHLKTKSASGWAGLWCRVDQLASGRPLAFDNMQDRPVKGTTEWTECVVVLDVPPAASNIAFGVLLNDKGTVWIDGMRLDVVDDSVPLTAPETTAGEPQNLDFAQTLEDDEPVATSAGPRGIGESSGDQRFCSFCHKAAPDVAKLIVGGGGHVHICNECVELCSQIIAEAG